MLVLSRKVNEQILIGKDIWLTIVEIRPGKVRVGIACPTGIPIVRKELLPPDEQKESPSAKR